MVFAQDASLFLSLYSSLGLSGTFCPGLLSTACSGATNRRPLHGSRQCKNFCLYPVHTTDRPTYRQTVENGRPMLCSNIKPSRREVTSFGSFGKFASSLRSTRSKVFRISQPINAITVKWRTVVVKTDEWLWLRSSLYGPKPSSWQWLESRELSYVWKSFRLSCSWIQPDEFYSNSYIFIQLSRF